MQVKGGEGMYWFVVTTDLFPLLTKREISQDGGGVDFSLPLSLRKAYRMNLLSARSISLNSNF
jgi:hypothetical protein